jgi:hypothetical protein
MIAHWKEPSVHEVANFANSRLRPANVKAQQWEPRMERALKAGARDGR